MKFIVLLIFIWPAVLGRRLDRKIVGGQDVDIKDFPYQLSLEILGMHVCGASIISEKIALTAAHCTDGLVALGMAVRAGSSRVGHGGTRIHVHKFIQHPEFNFPDYDLSLLFLSFKLPIGEPGYAVIKLADEGGPPPEGARVNVTGWGDLSPGGSSPEQLQQIEVEVYSMERCRQIYGSSMTDRVFCAGIPEGGKDACQGDSGGPLVANGILYGAVSGGFSCALPDYPSYYASVPSLRQWIREEAGL